MRLPALIACAVMLGAAAPSQPTPQAAEPNAEQQQSAGPRGTPGDPLVVKLIPAPKSSAEAYAEERDNQRKAEVERKGLITNIALAVFAFLQLIVTAITLLGLRHARVAANAAEDAADAARKSVEAMARAERAYVFFGDTQKMDEASHGMFRVTWRNDGKTPAFVTRVRLGVECADNPPHPSSMPAYEFPFGAVIGAGQRWRRGNVSVIEAMVQQAKSDEPIWLCGEITYKTIHGEECRSWFCRMYTGFQFILDADVDPALNGYT